jgi:hypothetical protein
VGTTVKHSGPRTRPGLFSSERNPNLIAAPPAHRRSSRFAGRGNLKIEHWRNSGSIAERKFGAVPRAVAHDAFDNAKAGIEAEPAAQENAPARLPPTFVVTDRPSH